MERSECLEILGLDEDPSKDEIKAAYRKLAKLWHPDKNPDPNAKYKFNEVHQAMKTLLEDEEDISTIYDAMEMFKFILKEYLMKRYYYTYSCYDEDDDFYSFDSDEDDDEFFDFFEGQSYSDYMNDYRTQRLKEEAQQFKCFNDWKVAQKAKRMQKLKETAPVRPKQLKKKQQEHLEHQRDRESAKIRDELMKQMEERKIKEEKRLHKEEEKRREVQEEIKRNLEETVTKTQVFTKAKRSKSQVNGLQKPKIIIKNKKEKITKVLSSSSEDNNHEITSCNSVDVKNEEFWDGEETSTFNSFAINLPSSERLKEERQARLGDILRKARSMKCVEEWNMSPEEPPQQQPLSDLWDVEEADAPSCPTRKSVSDNRLSRVCCEERSASSDQTRFQRVSPSFWESDDESSHHSPTTQPSFDDNQMSNEERMRCSEIQKLRRMEERRNSRERDEIRAVESFHRRQTAMEKRQMEISPRFRNRSISCTEPVNNDTCWYKKPREPERKADVPRWDEGKCKVDNTWSKPMPPSQFLPTENVWKKRMAFQNERQGIVPSTIDDEEAMLQKAIQLSQIQYVEDERARFKLFEESALEENVPEIAESQRPSESLTSSNHVPSSHTDFANINSKSRSSSKTDDDLVTSESYSSSDTNESHIGRDAPTREEPSVEDDEQQFGCFSSVNGRWDIEKPAQMPQTEASTLKEHCVVDGDQEFRTLGAINGKKQSSFSSAMNGKKQSRCSRPFTENNFKLAQTEAQVNLNSERSSFSRAQEEMSSQFQPPVPYHMEAAVKLEKPAKTPQPELSSSYRQENGTSEAIPPKVVNLKPPPGIPKRNVVYDQSYRNAQKNDMERPAIHLQTNVPSSFRVVKHDLEKSRANGSEFPHPFSKTKETTSHITDTGFEKDSEAAKLDAASSNTAKMFLPRSVSGSQSALNSETGLHSESGINSAAPPFPFPKSATTVPSITTSSNRLPRVNNVDTSHCQQVVNHMELLESPQSATIPSVTSTVIPEVHSVDSNFKNLPVVKHVKSNSLDTLHSREKLCSADDTTPPVSAHSLTRSSEEQASASSIVPSSRFTKAPLQPEAKLPSVGDALPAYSFSGSVTSHSLATGHEEETGTSPLHPAYSLNSSNISETSAIGNEGQTDRNVLNHPVVYPSVGGEDPHSASAYSVARSNPIQCPLANGQDDQAGTNILSYPVVPFALHSSVEDPLSHSVLEYSLNQFDSSLSSATGQEEQAVPARVFPNCPILPSSGFTIPPQTPTGIQPVMASHNYFGASAAGPSAFLPPPSGFPLFPGLPTPNGLANMMSNNLFPATPFAFPFHPQLGANGLLGYNPQMYPLPLGGNDWYGASLPPSYRKLMEISQDTPAPSNPLATGFLPMQNGFNPFASAVSNPLAAAAFLSMQNGLTPPAPTTSNPFPAAAFPPVQNTDRFYVHDRAAESQAAAAVPEVGDLDNSQQQLNACGRGRGVSPRSHEAKNIGVGLDKESGKLDGVSSLGPPPKDVRLRKRWEKQIEELSKKGLTSNT